MNRALLIHQAALGDFLVVCRLIGHCNGIYGEHAWSYLGKPSHGRLAGALGLVTAFENFDAPGWHLLFAPGETIPDPMREFLGRFDLVLNVLAGPGKIVSRRLETLCRGRVFHVEPKLPEAFGGHVFEFLAGQVRNSGPIQLPATALPVAPDLVAEVEREVPARRLVLFHPGASTPVKRLPVAHYLELIDQAVRAGEEPGIILGEVEMEQFPTPDIERLKSAGRIFFGWPLEKVAALLSLSKKYIGNDNGVSHLAGAVGADATVYFIWARPANWRPLGPRVKVVCPPPDGVPARP
jgi:heptosyltransferase III